MYEMNFETVCKYAENKYSRRQGKSRAKDMSQKYFTNPWSRSKKRYMVLFEGEKQIARGHTEPEVYWVVVEDTGRIRKMPARNIRQMTFIPGFSFLPGVWERICEFLDWVKENKENGEL